MWHVIVNPWCAVSATWIKNNGDVGLVGCFLPW